MIASGVSPNASPEHPTPKIKHASGKNRAGQLPSKFPSADSEGALEPWGSKRGNVASKHEEKWKLLQVFLPRQLVRSMGIWLLLSFSEG
jgi:hypothetical protein